MIDRVPGQVIGTAGLMDSVHKQNEIFELLKFSKKHLNQKLFSQFSAKEKFESEASLKKFFGRFKRFVNTTSLKKSQNLENDKKIKKLKKSNISKVMKYFKENEKKVLEMLSIEFPEFHLMDKNNPSNYSIQKIFKNQKIQNPEKGQKKANKNTSDLPFPYNIFKPIKKLEFPQQELDMLFKRDEDEQKIDILRKRQEKVKKSIKDKSLWKLKKFGQTGMEDLFKSALSKKKAKSFKLISKRNTDLRTNFTRKLIRSQRLGNKTNSNYNLDNSIRLFSTKPRSENSPYLYKSIKRSNSQPFKKEQIGKVKKSRLKTSMNRLVTKCT
jgi:hypothetical protein